MRNIKALLYFSTNKPSYIKAWLLLLLAMFASTPALTCGPGYDSLRMDMLPSFGFDPRTPSIKDADFLWDQFIYQRHHQALRASAWESKSEKVEIAEFHQMFNAAFAAAGRRLKITTGTQGSSELNTNEAIKFVEVNFPRESYYSWGSCVSNNRTAYLTFVQAAIADPIVNDEELMQLIGLRYKLMEVCGDAGDLESFKALLVTASDVYRRYLLAISYFYSNDYEKASAGFAKIAQEKSHLLSEVSLYLIGRCYLRENQPQEEFESFFASDDEKAKARQGNLKAVQAFEEYLAAYPQGRYADSARGLIRRAQWLAGNQKIYADQLQIHIDQRMTHLLAGDGWNSKDHYEMGLLFAEYQRFVDVDHKNLQAMEALLNVVKIQDAGRSNKHQSLADLKNFVLLYKEYQQGNYSSVIQQLQDQHQYRLPEFVLLVRALEVSGDWQKALSLWSSARANDKAYLVRDNASYEMARILVAQQGIQDLLRDKSFDHPDESARWETDSIKANYLASLCGDAEQRVWLADTSISINSRQLILSDIAKRHLYRENFSDLHQVFNQYPDEILSGFASIRTAVRQVAEQKQLGKAYMNIGYFMQERITPLGYLPAALDKAQDEEAIQKPGKNCPQTVLHGDGGDAAGPYYYYNRALAYFGEAKSTDEAKTLHFITMCFKTGSEYSGSCLWGHKNAGEQTMTSEQAFKQLHKKYSGSEWAEKTPYHY